MVNHTYYCLVLLATDRKYLPPGGTGTRSSEGLYGAYKEYSTALIVLIIVEQQRGPKFGPPCMEVVHLAPYLN